MIDDIIKKFLKSDDLDYGCYGTKTFFLKRWLWWKRLKIADKIYLNYKTII